MYKIIIKITMNKEDLDYCNIFIIYSYLIINFFSSFSSFFFCLHVNHTNKNEKNERKRTSHNNYFTN